MRYLVFLIVLLWGFPAQAQGTASFQARFDKIGTAAFENRNPTKPMNVVLLFVDDVGKELWLPSHETGPATSTTNLDSLRTQGITFSNAYVTPLCGSTHVQIQSGRWQFRTQSSGPGGLLSSNELALGNQIRKSDQPYRSAWFGKFNAQHSTGTGGGGFATASSDFGWDYLVGFGGCCGLYTLFTETTNHGYRNGNNSTDGGISNTTDYLGDKVFADAISWLGTIGDDPYVLVVSSHIAHSQFHNAGSTDLEVLGEDSLDCPLSSIEHCQSSMIDRWDDQIPSLLSAIDTSNTLVIFISDDGDARRGDVGVCDWDPAHEGSKGSLHECGINVGMVMAYGDIPAAKRNTTDTSLTSIVDISATIADVVGAKYLPTRFPSDASDSKYNGQKRIQDGLSLRSIWSGRCNGYEYCWTRDGGSTRLAHSGNGAAGDIRVLRNATHKIFLDRDNTTYTCYSMNPPNEDPDEDGSTNGIACDSTHDALKASLTALEATGS
jgi:hypothetical protein